MDINQLNIQKVANGYIVREGFVRGDFTCHELAVFNDVNDMCEWIKQNFTLGADKPQNPFVMPAPGVTIGKAGIGFGPEFPKQFTRDLRTPTAEAQ